MAAAAPWIGLRDGSSMPWLGFGTWQIDNTDASHLVAEAIRAGYRGIDTAQGYRNEEGVGRAIAQSDVPRSELFVTSKLRNGAHARDAALEAFDLTMDSLGLEQLDLFLIHWPAPEQNLYVEAWRTLIELQAQGRIRSIGVSNFDPVHIDRLIAETGVTPVLDQIELHPRFQQRDKRAYMKRHDIRLASWSPLGPGTGGTAWWAQFGGEPGLSALADPAIAAIAARLGKTPAQVILRWHLQEGLLINAKSSRPERITENRDIFDFTLDAEDMYRIEAMDDARGKLGPQPAAWNRIF